MQWNDLLSISQIESIAENAEISIIFKHSNRCGISSTALYRIESFKEKYSSLPYVFYFLDLVKHREISNDIAKRFEVEHQSPQILVIENGICIYNVSHLNIKPSELYSFLTDRISLNLESLQN